MWKFSKISLTIIFISIICYIPSVDADEPVTEYESVYGAEEEYKVHLQVIVRDKNSQLIYVAETTVVNPLYTYLPNGDPVPQWTSVAVDRVLMKNYQSVTIDDKQYERADFKLVYTNSISEFPSADSFLGICMDIEVHGPTCIKSFVAMLPMVILEDGDVTTHQWTVLREI
jgi:hypothetical protein